MTPEKRRALTFRELIVPIVAATLVGGLTAYVAIEKSITAMDGRLNTFQADLGDMTVIIGAVRQNQLELAARGEWMKSTSETLKKMSNSVDSIQGHIYTKTDAKKDMEMIKREIDLRHTK